MTYSPAELDILSRAFHSAIDSLSLQDRDAEATKAVIMTGILDTARTGERDEEKLKELALEAVKLYEVGERGLEAAMTTVHALGYVSGPSPSSDATDGW